MSDKRIADLEAAVRFLLQRVLGVGEDGKPVTISAAAEAEIKIEEAAKPPLAEIAVTQDDIGKPQTEFGLAQPEFGLDKWAPLADFEAMQAELDKVEAAVMGLLARERAEIVTLVQARAEMDPRSKELLTSAAFMAGKTPDEFGKAAIEAYWAAVADIMQSEG